MNGIIKILMVFFMKIRDSNTLSFLILLFLFLSKPIVSISQNINVEFSMISFTPDNKFMQMPNSYAWINYNTIGAYNVSYNNSKYLSQGGQSAYFSTPNCVDYGFNQLLGSEVSDTFPLNQAFNQNTVGNTSNNPNTSPSSTAYKNFTFKSYYPSSTFQYKAACEGGGNDWLKCLNITFPVGQADLNIMYSQRVERFTYYFISANGNNRYPVNTYINNGYSALNTTYNEYGKYYYKLFNTNTWQLCTTGNCVGTYRKIPQYNYKPSSHPSYSNTKTPVVFLVDTTINIYAYKPGVRHFPNLKSKSGFVDGTIPYSTGKMKVFLKWSPPKPTTPTSSATTVCAKDEFTLSTSAISFPLSAGFTHYKWQYRLGSATNWSELAETTTENYTFNLPDAWAGLYEFRVMYKFNSGYDENSASDILAGINVWRARPTVIVGLDDIIPSTCYQAGNGSLRVDNVTGGSGDYVLSLWDQAAFSPISGLPPYPFTYNTLPGGNYTLSVFNINSIGSQECFTTIPGIVVPEPDPLIATPAAVVKVAQASINYHTNCSYDTDGQITLAATGGNGSYRYSINSGGFSAVTSFSNLDAGTYSINVTDSKNCPMNNATAPQIPILKPTPLSITGITRSDYSGYNISCYGLSTGSIGYIASGGIFPYTYKLTNQTDKTNSRYYQMFEGLSTVTSYIPSIVDARNCVLSSSSITLTQPTPLQIRPIAIATHNHPLAHISCHRNIQSGTTNDGQVSVTGTGGIVANPYKFFLNGTQLSTPTSQNFISNSITGIKHGYVFDALTVGGYNYTIQDGNNCTVNSNFTLLEPPLLTITGIVHTPATCFDYMDGRSNITIAGGITGTWVQEVERLRNSYPTDNNHIFTRDSTYHIRSTTGFGYAGMPIGSYQYTTTDINGCTYTTSRPMSEATRLNAGITKGYVICLGDSNGMLKLNPSGGSPPYRAYWAKPLQTNNPYVASGYTITGLKAGNYEAYLTDAHNCYNGNSSGRVQVPTIGSVLGAVFTGATIESPSSKLRIINSIATQVSCYQAHDGNIKVTAGGGWKDAVPSIQTGFKGTTGCFYGVDKVNYGTNSIIRSLSGGNFKIYLKDPVGCTDSSAVYIYEPKILSITGIRTTDALCYNSADGLIALSVAGGNMRYRYKLWKPVANNAPLNLRTSTVPGFAGLIKDNYFITVRDSLNCGATTTGLAINHPNEITHQMANKESTCGRPDGGLAVTVTGGILPYRYQWKPQTGTLSVVTSLAGLYGVGSGIYSVSIADAHACNKTFTGAVNDQSGPLTTTTVVQLPLCSYSNEGVLRMFQLREGKRPYQYQWLRSDSAGILGTETIIGHLFGFKTYIAGTRDADGCFSSSSIYLHAPSRLQTSISGIENPICYHEKNGQMAVAVRGGTSPYSYRWNNSTNSVSALASGLEAYKDTVQQKQYKVAILDAHLCQTSDSAVIFNPKQVKVKLDLDTALVCAGQSITLTAHHEQATSFAWSGANNFSKNTQVATMFDDGTYIIKVNNNHNCSASDTFRMRTSTQVMDAYFLTNTKPFAGDSVVLVEITWPAPDSVQWLVPEGLIMLKKEGPYMYLKTSRAGDFVARLTAFSGICSDTLYKTIYVQPAKKQRKEEPYHVGFKGIKSIEAFPNPTSGNLQVHVKLAEEGKLLIRLLNLMGTPVLTLEPNQSLVEHEINIDMSGYASGIYLLHVRSEYGEKLVKIVRE